MLANLETYKKDLESLIERGNLLLNAMQYECYPIEMERRLKELFGDKANEVLVSIPSFTEQYQSWYSESKVLIKQLMPDRLHDFVQYYEKPKQRKDIDYENYKIDDFLQGLTVTRGYEKTKVVGPDAAIPKFKQQLAIITAVNKRFESSLFEIHQLVQADLFDSELDAAKELAKFKFSRAAGALAGVVLEKHLAQVCCNHNVKLTKKSAAISDLNDALKEASVIDIPQWRFVQHLADIRNLCDHNKKVEPTNDQVDDLIGGVTKMIKTLY